jgi:hypothetical protein
VNRKIFENYYQLKWRENIMKNALKKYITAFFLMVPVLTPGSNINDDILVRYYSKLLSINLNHLTELTKNLYDLTSEPSFKKENLETELVRLDNQINQTNTDIDAMMEYIPEENLEKIEKYLTGIDKRLAQAYIDIESLRKGINNQDTIDIPNLVSDILDQVKEANSVDKVKFMKIQNQLSKNLLEQNEE